MSVRSSLRSNGHITGIHGRVQALAPGLPCFTCCELLDSEEVRRDMMNSEERRRDPYIPGAHEPAPAVISINGTVTSIAMTMFLAMTLGVPSDGRHVLYNGRDSTRYELYRSPEIQIAIFALLAVSSHEATHKSLFTRDD